MSHTSLTDHEKAQWLLKLASGPNPKKLLEEHWLFVEIHKFFPEHDWDECSTRQWYAQVWNGLKMLTIKWKQYRHWKVRIGVYHVAVMWRRNSRLKILPKKEELSPTDEVAQRVYEAMCLLEGRLRRCASSRCNKFFIGRKRQRYCSRKCGVGVRVRKHRRNQSHVRARESADCNE